MPNITALLSTLITASHILHHHTILDALGHVSARNPLTNSTFYLGLAIGPLLVSSPREIGEYHVADGSPLPGTTGGYAERYIHSAVYAAYPDVQAVVHSHAEDVLPYTILEGAGVQVEPTYHMTGFLGPAVPNFDIESAYQESDARDMLVNSPRLGAALAAAFGLNTTRPTAPLHTTVLQRGHGFVTTGRSVEEATVRAYYVASNARVQTRALGLTDAVGSGPGGVKYLSEQERRDCANMNAWVTYRSWNQWVREVERSGLYDNELGTPPSLPQ